MQPNPQTTRFLLERFLMVSSKVLRRDFLKAAVAGAVVLATKRMPARAISDESILILGAGVAGLSTAKFLQQAGYSDIKILEGRQRIGGRTWTSHAWDDLPLDMGASWIHGIDNNPIWDLAQSAGIETVETSEDDVVAYYADGSQLTDAEAQELQDEGEALLAAAEPDEDEEDYSLQEAIDEVLADETLSDDERQALDFWLGTVIGHEYAAELRELSALSWAEDEGYDGAEVIFQKGYEQIVNLLAQNLDIKLEQIVQEIHIEEDGVRVVTHQGEFRADRCVVTLPLGVLKKGDVRFSPALPDDKQEAIELLGMGLLNKLYLRFPSVFWEAEAGWIDYLAPEKGEWLEWLNFDYYLGAPVLLGFNSGDYGRRLEAMSDEQIVARAMETLRRIYGDDIPEPTQWQVTRWAADPFSYGSYSYNGVGSSHESREALAEPIDGVLFFAGEATVSDFPSTVHGAYLSGVRAAQALIEAS
jgi:monoamine oxidase